MAEIKCPTNERHPGDLVGCGSTNVIGPDEEGLCDCMDCGLFFEVLEELARFGTMPEKLTKHTTTSRET